MTRTAVQVVAASAGLLVTLIDVHLAGVSLLLFAAIVAIVGVANTDALGQRAGG